MTIDWVAVVVIGLAYVISLQKTVPQRWRHGIFAVAFFGIAAYRFSRGSAPAFPLLAAAFGVYYLVQAARSPR